jgi:hypothetical protein
MNKIDFFIIQKICDFLDHRTIHNLKLTDKNNYKIIPKKFILHCVTINKLYEFSYNLKDLRDYRYILYFNILKVINHVDFLKHINTLDSINNPLKTLRFPLQLERLIGIEIMYEKNLKNINIDCNKSLKKINIQCCPNIENITLNKNLTKLNTLNISNTPITNIIIEKTWTNLITLCLVGTQITHLTIPSECKNLILINISSCPIREITLEKFQKEKPEKPEKRKLIILCYYTKHNSFFLYRSMEHMIRFIPNEEQVREVILE